MRDTEMKKISIPHWMWLSCLQLHPVHQKFAGSVPCQDAYLHCKVELQVGHIGRQPLDVSLISVYLSLSLFLSHSCSPAFPPHPLPLSLSIFLVSQERKKVTASCIMKV